MNKKSQAAMEFLLTYGWAIVVVVTALAALAYFGVLDVDRYAPSMCTLPAGLSCLDHGVTEYTFGTTKNRLTLNIKNNLGNTIDLVEIKSEFGKSKDLTSYDNLPNGKQTGTDIPNIRLDDITNGAPAILAGSKYEIDFTVTYDNIDSGLPHTVKGSVTGIVVKE